MVDKPVTDRPKPPAFPNVRPQPLALPYVAKASQSGSLRVGAGLALVNAAFAAGTGFVNGWVWLSAMGILVMLVAMWAWWRAGANEPTAAFEIREEGLLVNGNVRPFTSIAAARRTSSAAGILTIRRPSLWLEFDDGSTLGIGHWIINSAAIQAAVIERLPHDVRAHIETNSRLTQ